MIRILNRSTSHYLIHLIYICIIDVNLRLVFCENFTHLKIVSLEPHRLSAMTEANLRQSLSQLLLLVSSEHLLPLEDGSDFSSITNPIKLILSGESILLLTSDEYSSLVFTEKSKQILQNYPSNSLLTTLTQFSDEVAKSFNAYFKNESLASLHLQLVAIALLHTFIQVNFTGPSVGTSAREYFFPDSDEELLQSDALAALTIEGQQPYDLVINPLFLIVSLKFFEQLLGVSSTHSSISWNPEITLEDLTEETGKLAEDVKQDPIKASLHWWRARALQVHLSILSEPSNILSTISSILLNPSVPNSLSPASDNNTQIQKHIQLIYYLECARSGLQSQTEHLSIPYLIKARNLADLKLILTGAKAKRTKFQTFTTSNLIILAKSSKADSIYNMESVEDKPVSFELDSDLLLEKPQFESLENLSFGEDEQGNVKRLKFDYSQINDDEPEKLLPIAIREELIPEELRQLDPNNQPVLNDLDNIQLLLRLTTIKQTTPYQNAIIGEELLALVSRIIYASKDESKKTNWSVFSRALWERSLLETNKSKTIERGILQMTSLVEEIGIKIKLKMIPEAENSSPVSSRLRFIHQLPLMPQWTMNAKLAEKYMSLGVIRSAIEIYERLQMHCDAALCYAAVDDEKTAVKILVERIKKHPQDARAISILGDITQDPSLWQKAWDISRYSKAKVSLSKYYYNPPKESGLTRNVELSIQNMFDALTISPLIFENWYFYGCCGLETQQFELASEAFTRCVTLDDTNSHAWSNLATSLIKLDKLKPAFNALKKAIRSGQENRSWKIFENYLLVAMKLNEWNDVLYATREILDIRKNEGDVAIDIEVIESLTDILTAKEYDINARSSNFQTSCIDLICHVIPELITSSTRLWRIVAKVELYRKRPWSALECYEKAYRVLLQSGDLPFQESVWDEAVEACDDLIAAYESLGELPGKHGAEDVVCKDWKYKSKSSIRSLMSKGKQSWEDTPGWNKLVEMKEEL